MEVVWEEVVEIARKQRPSCLLEEIFESGKLEDERNEGDHHGTTESSHRVTDGVWNALGPLEHKVANLKSGEMDLGGGPIGSPDGAAYLGNDHTLLGVELWPPPPCRLLLAVTLLQSQPSSRLPVLRLGLAGAPLLARVVVHRRPTGLLVSLRVLT